jgi:hypothetical protein
MTYANMQDMSNAMSTEFVVRGFVLRTGLHQSV